MFRVNLTVCIAVWALKNTEKRRQRTQPRLVAGVVAPTFVGVNYLPSRVWTVVWSNFTLHPYTAVFYNALDYYIKSRKLCQTFESVFFTWFCAFFIKNCPFLPRFPFFASPSSVLVPPFAFHHKILIFCGKIRRIAHPLSSQKICLLRVLYFLIAKLKCYITPFLKIFVNIFCDLFTF